MKARWNIVGAGLAGTLMGIYLAQKKEDVFLFERRRDMRIEPVPRGRSINLALSNRGIHALKQVGFAEEVLKEAVPMKGRMIHHRDGTTLFQPYSIHPNDVLYSVSRQGLNIGLLNAFERLQCGRIFFNQKCTNFDLKQKKLIFQDQKTGEVQTIKEGIIIGADGAHSVIRKEMQNLDRFQYRQDYLDWGYKELTIPAGENQTFLLEKNALHIWPRESFMLIALPNTNGSFTCTLFLSFQGDPSFEALQSPEDILKFFKEQFPDALPLMPTLVDDFQHNPTSSLIYLRCFPWHYKDTVVLIGDACHAVVPFYGQGMNAAFEDCFTLSRCLAAFQENLEEAFQHYEALRKPNTDALADLSLENFVEMRKKTASKIFLFEKKLENFLYKLFPSHFIPLYIMVTFSLTPYAEAVKKARRQKESLKKGAVAAAILFLVFLIFLAKGFLF
jgi:kynurenine 3-monooxygenase